MSEGQPALDCCFAMRIENVRAIYNDVGEQWSPWRAVRKVAMPLGVTLYVISGGALVFDFSSNHEFCGGAVLDSTDIYSPEAIKRQSIVRKRTGYMNAFSATLYHGGQPLFAFEALPSVTAENYLSALSHSDGDWEVIGPHHADGRECPSEVFTRAAKAFQDIVEADWLANRKGLGQQGVVLLSLLQTASLHFKNHEFSSSLLIGWSVVESLLNLTFENMLASAKTDGRTKISADRKKTLMGKDYTASVISQILSLNGCIEDGLLHKLDEARKKRNDFAHKLHEVSWKDASNVLGLAAQMISMRAGFAFRLPISFSWRN